MSGTDKFTNPQFKTLETTLIMDQLFGFATIEEQQVASERDKFTIQIMNLESGLLWKKP